MGKPVFPPCCLTWGQTGGGNENNGHLLQKVPCTHFSNNHVRMWELDHKESSVWKNWCFWTVVLEKTLESPLDSKKIQPVHPNQSWIFTGRTDAEAEAPILWPPDEKSWLIGKDPDSGKDWRWEEKGTTEDEMVEGLTDSTDISLSKLQVLVMYREACRSAVHGVAKSWTQLSDWTEHHFTDVKLRWSNWLL